MVLLSANSICVSFGTNTILDNVNFSINEDDRLGVVGINGAGKTTLARIIAKDNEPTSGNIFIAKNKTIGYLAQNAIIESNLNVFDEMLLAFPEAYAIDNRLEEIERKLNESKEDYLINEYSAFSRFGSISDFISIISYEDGFEDSFIGTILLESNVIIRRPT